MVWKVGWDGVGWEGEEGKGGVELTSQNRESAQRGPPMQARGMRRYSSLRAQGAFLAFARSR